MQTTNNNELLSIYANLVRDIINMGDEMPVSGTTIRSMMRTRGIALPDAQGDPLNVAGVPMDVLFPRDHPARCERGSNCAHAVAEWRGRFYITGGHAGFNSTTNNRTGYVSPNAAVMAIVYYEAKGARNGRRA